MKNIDLTTTKKILILGDAGRGKSTLAKKLSEKLIIPMFSTDDYLSRLNATKSEKDSSIEKVKEIYKKDNWIVEGATTYLVQPGLPYADVILHLGFQTLFSQWKSVIKRNQHTKEKSFFDLVNFLIFLARKRYGIGYKSNRKKRREVLSPYKDKVVYITSFRQVDELLKE